MTDGWDMLDKEMIHITDRTAEDVNLLLRMAHNLKLKIAYFCNFFRVVADPWLQNAESKTTDEGGGGAIVIAKCSLATTNQN